MFVPSKLQTQAAQETKPTGPTPIGFQKSKPEEPKPTNDSHDKIRSVVDPYSNKWFSLETMINVKNIKKKGALSVFKVFVFDSF
jgi:hypothetical protein